MDTNHKDPNTQIKFLDGETVNAVHAIDNDRFVFSIKRDGQYYKGGKVKDGSLALYDRTLEGPGIPFDQLTVTPPLELGFGNLREHPTNTIIFPEFWSEDLNFTTKEDMDAVSMNFDPPMIAGYRISPVGGSTLGVYCEAKKFLVEIIGTDDEVWDEPNHPGAVATVKLKSGTGTGTWTGHSATAEEAGSEGRRAAPALVG